MNLRSLKRFIEGGARGWDGQLGRRRGRVLQHATSEFGHGVEVLQVLRKGSGFFFRSGGTLLRFLPKPIDVKKGHGR